MDRDAQGASSQNVEVLDNGLMNKRLERLADAERLFHERYENSNKTPEPTVIHGTPKKN